MAISIPTNIDHGSRNRVLREVAAGIAAAGGTVNGAIASTAGETEPNWLKFMNALITGANALPGGSAIPLYVSLDYNHFYTALSKVVNKVNAVPPPVPVITTPPAVTPSATQVNGAVLTTTNGTWTNSPTGYTRSWQRDGVAINPAQSGLTYTTVAADATHTVRCSVVAANAGGNSAASNSNGVAIT